MARIAALQCQFAGLMAGPWRAAQNSCAGAGGPCDNPLNEPLFAGIKRSTYCLGSLPRNRSPSEVRLLSGEESDGQDVFYPGD